LTSSVPWFFHKQVNLSDVVGLLVQVIVTAVKDVGEGVPHFPVVLNSLLTLQLLVLFDERSLLLDDLLDLTNESKPFLLYSVRSEWEFDNHVLSMICLILLINFHHHGEVFQLSLGEGGFLDISDFLVGI